MERINGRMLITGRILYYVIGCIISVAKCILPVNNSLLTSETYPYCKNLSNNALKNAEDGWKQLDYWQKRDFIWFNTYIFIPNQPGNPYKFCLY